MDSDLPVVESQKIYRYSMGSTTYAFMIWIQKARSSSASLMLLARMATSSSSLGFEDDMTEGEPTGSGCYAFNGDARNIHSANNLGYRSWTMLSCSKFST